MNVPNKLTVLRVFLAPLFLLVMLWEFPHHQLVACALFALASLTDLLDGRLARKYGLVTNLGKFLDPLADKMLTTAALLGFLAAGQLDVWAVMLVLSREFMVTSVRLLAARDGTVVAADMLGKVKTVAQMIAILYYLLALDLFPACTVLHTVGRCCIWVSVVLTLISGLRYFWQYRHLFLQKK